MYFKIMQKNEHNRKAKMSNYFQENKPAMPER